MKKISIWSLLPVLLFSLLLMGSGTEKADANYRVITATDLHYLAPELTDHGEYFWRVMENADGKVTEYCEEITEAFLAEVIEEQPEALILTGDLSFNGARASHEALAKKLAGVENAGVPVFVLPGNHDVYRGTSASFFGEGYELVPSVTGEEFAQIYGAFGFDEALSRDTDSASYMAQLNEGTRLLMLDANTLHDYCSLSGKSLSWAEKQLKDAQKENMAVLAACHQNLYQHSIFRGGYMLDCSEQLHELLERYGVRLILSGHMHIQHIRTEGTVTEIAGSPLTMGECRYGVLSCEAGSYTYEARCVAVSDWAKAQGIRNEDLLRFPDYPRERLENRTRVQAREQLDKKGITGEEQDALTAYACALNTAYFTGDLSRIPALDPDGTLLARWEESGTSFGSYFASIREEIGKNHCLWEQDK